MLIFAAALLVLAVFLVAALALWTVGKVEQAHRATNFILHTVNTEQAKTIKDLMNRLQAKDSTEYRTLTSVGMMEKSTTSPSEYVAMDDGSVAKRMYDAAPPGAIIFDEEYISAMNDLNGMDRT